MQNKIRKQLQVEVDSAFLYQRLSEKYKDKVLSHVLSKMADIELHHAQVMLNKLKALDPSATQPKPSFRAKIQAKLADIFGCDYVLQSMATLERQMSKATIERKKASGEKITGLENTHYHIIQSLNNHGEAGIGGIQLSTLEGKHKLVGGNELRAAVLGANDGLVSNMSLVMGVVGASAGEGQILIAGIAGLLAGSISMALGEWISVQSSRELYQRQVDIEAEEIEASPEEEMQELALLYQARGLEEKEALKLAQDNFSNKEVALESLVREELGYDREILSISAWKAAFASFFLFSFGAFIPVIAFIFYTGGKATVVSLILSTFGLFFIGASITLFTGRNFIKGGLRQVIFGLTAAGITYYIGKLIGVAIVS